MGHLILIICVLLVFPGFFACDSQTGEKMTQSQPNVNEMQITVETMKQVLEAFNRHDPDAIMEFFADECTLDMPRGPEPWGKRYNGKKQVREALAGRFKGIPDVHYSNDEHWVAGDRGVSEWTLTGTTTAGVTLKVRGCDLWEFRNGKIIRKNSYWKIVD